MEKQGSKVPDTSQSSRGEVSDGATTKTIEPHPPHDCGPPVVEKSSTAPVSVKPAVEPEEGSDLVKFLPTSGRHLDADHVLFSRPMATEATKDDHELMGPLLRRKKVVSMPLGAGGRQIIV